MSVNQLHVAAYRVCVVDSVGVADGGVVGEVAAYGVKGGVVSSVVSGVVGGVVGCVVSGVVGGVVSGVVGETSVGRNCLLNAFSGVVVFVIRSPNFSMRFFIIIVVTTTNVLVVVIITIVVMLPSIKKPSENYMIARNFY